MQTCANHYLSLFGIQGSVSSLHNMSIWDYDWVDDGWIQIQEGQEETGIRDARRELWNRLQQSVTCSFDVIQKFRFQRIPHPCVSQRQKSRDAFQLE